MSESTKASPSKKAAYTYAVGRRKRAIARVRLYPVSKSENNADIIVNDQPIQTYLRLPGADALYLKPLKLTNTVGRYKITVKVSGSGVHSQLGAIAHGISRALVKVDAEYKPILRKNNLITRDPREKQRRMIGTGGKARRQKQSPKR